MPAQEYVNGILAGEPRAIAKALTRVENHPALGAAILDALASHLGRAHRVGITGPPGVGKSTLVSALIGSWRAEHKRVGVLAVDPSSPFTGGALLGDRIRMTQHLGDSGVFVRSLASRGAGGGLAAAAEDAADVLDAGGFDPVVVETVGVGQGEMDVAGAVDTTVLVLAPGAGDDIQALKAGLLEMADIVVVNQADRAGADRLEAALRGAFELRAVRGVETAWRPDGGTEPGPAGTSAGVEAQDPEAPDAPSLPPAPPVFLTTATTGEGVDAVRAAIDARVGPDHAGLLKSRRFRRAVRRVRAEADRLRAEWFWDGQTARLGAMAREVLAGKLVVREAARRLVEDIEIRKARG